MNKVEAQAQNMVESCQGLTHSQKIMSLSDAPHASKLVQIKGKTIESTLMASLYVQQLQDMITNTIKAQYGKPSQSTPMYSKSYTKRIDNLRIPMDY